MTSVRGNNGGNVTRRRRARRANGEGSVWERPDTGRIQASVVVGWTPKGNARRISKSFDTKGQARAWIAEQQVALSRGARLDDTATLREAFDEWLAAGERLKGWAPATIRSYKGTLEKHALPYLGRMRLRDVTASDVRRLLLTLTNDGVSDAMRRRVRNYLGLLLRDAQRMGLIPSNPVENVSAPAAPEPRVQRWSEEEVARVVRACLDRDDQSARYVLVALGTGLRIEELLGLTWAAVDLVERMMEVRQVATESGPKEIRAGGKTEASERVVAFDAFTASVLARQREHVTVLKAARVGINEKRAARNEKPLPWHELDLVFCTRTGTILDRGTLRRHLAEITQAAQVPRLRLYATRHTHGSLLADAGVNLHALAERLGHADRSFTARRYLRGSSSAHRAVADTVGGILTAGARCNAVAVGTTNPVQEAPFGDSSDAAATSGTTSTSSESPN